MAAARGTGACRRWCDACGCAGLPPEVGAPPGLQLQLRSYQLQGLAWLQYLREHHLAGILADEMGLGKTAQVLAHLLLEKHAGRLDLPALVVLPTTWWPTGAPRLRDRPAICACWPCKAASAAAISPASPRMTWS
jgi:hypothetical protein